MYAPGAILPDLSDATSSGTVGRLLDRHGPRIASALDAVQNVTKRWRRP